MDQTEPVIEDSNLEIRSRLKIWVVVIVLCSAFGLTRSYTSMAGYDDESYVMMSVKTYLEGHRLYGDTYSQYGPAYYQIQTPLHGWLGIPITHDIVRIKTVVSWVLVSLMSGWLVIRVSGVFIAGPIATLLVMLHLEKFGLEPAHPQEVVALLSAAALLLLGWRNGIGLVLAGFCAALAGLTKLNAGATLALPMLFAAACLANFRIRSHPNPQTWTGSRMVFLATSLLCCGLPLVIFYSVAKDVSHGAHWYIAVWPALLCLASFLSCVMCWQVGRSGNSVQSPIHPSCDSISLWSFLGIAIGGIIGSALVVNLALLNGNTFGELAWGILLQHSFMSKSFYQPVLPNSIDICLALMVGGLMVFFLIGRSRKKVTENLTSMVLILPTLAMVFVVLLLVVEVWKPVEHGLIGRGAARFLTTVGPMLMPCLLLREVTLTRVALVMSGCLAPLLAYPVPGTQISLGTVSVLVGLVICVSDATQNPKFQNWPELVLKNSGWVVMVAILSSAILFGSRWTTMTPLDQPGCRWLRLQSERAAVEKGVAEAIRATESDWLFFDLQNYNRFFFWAGKRPLTAISPTFWPNMVTEEQRLRIVNALQKAGNVCVVKVPVRRTDLEELAPEIHDQISKGWVETGKVGEWVIGIRKSD